MNKKSPNILLIIVDTGRFKSLSPFGSKRNLCPNLREISKEGISFSRAYSASPWTLPSHASLFTGLYPSEHNTNAKHTRLDKKNYVMAEFLGSVGYDTFGIANNFWLTKAFGMDKGFKVFVKNWLLIQKDMDMFEIKEAMKYLKGGRRIKEMFRGFRKGNPLTNAINGLYSRFLYKRYDDGARVTNKRVIKFLRNTWSKKNPFFIFINYFEPHLPYRPPSEFRRKFIPEQYFNRYVRNIDQSPWKFICGISEKTKDEFEILSSLYNAEIAYVDQRIGELFNFLKENGLDEETIIIITSDHGENIGEHNLMDHQYCLYEELIKVPLVIRWPGLSSSFGVMYDKIVQSVDIFPSIVSLLGYSENRKPMSGRSFIKNGRIVSRREYAYAEYLAPMPAIETLKERFQNVKKDIGKFDRKLCSVISSDKKKLIYSSDGLHEMYDLEKDPFESNNILSSDSKTANELKDLLIRIKDKLRVKKDQESVAIDKEIKKRLESLGYLVK